MIRLSFSDLLPQVRAPVSSAHGEVAPSAALRSASNDVGVALSDGRSAAVRTYAAAVVGCAPGRITAVTRFGDGNRHEVYKVSYVNAEGAVADLVVRVSLTDDAAERAQAEREARVLQAIGGRAGPSLYDFSLTSAWFDTPTMSMAFVPGHQMPLSDATPAEIERLGSVVASVHAHPVDDVAEWLSETGDIASYAAARMRSILAGVTWLRDPLPAPTQARVREIAASLEQNWEVWRAAASFSTGEKLALLHGDIALGNVLWSPRPVLIDWEYTRLGDPADEIAYLFDQNGLSAPQQVAFWRGYQARSSNGIHLAHLIHRVNWWEPMTLLGSALWWVQRWVRRIEADLVGAVDVAVAREPGYYLDHVIRRLDRLENLVDRR